MSKIIDYLGFLEGIRINLLANNCEEDIHKRMKNFIKNLKERS